MAQVSYGIVMTWHRNGMKQEGRTRNRNDMQEDCAHSSLCSLYSFTDNKTKIAISGVC